MWISPTAAMSWPQLSRSAVTPRAETASSLEISTAGTRRAGITRQPPTEAALELLVLRTTRVTTTWRTLGALLICPADDPVARHRHAARVGDRHLPRRRGRRRVPVARRQALRGDEEVDRRAGRADAGLPRGAAVPGCHPASVRGDSQGGVDVV